MLAGGGGNDLLVGGPGADKLSCGAGQDTRKGDAKDKIAGDCEMVKGVPGSCAAIHGATAAWAATSATGAEGTARHLLRQHGPRTAALRHD